MQLSYTHIWTGICILDVDECKEISGTPDDCDDNAQCNNYPGSFECSCNTGYDGDGFNCTGKRWEFVDTFLIENKTFDSYC